jgi:protein O-mannosyl-transferase
MAARAAAAAPPPAPAPGKEPASPPPARGWRAAAPWLAMAGLLVVAALAYQPAVHGGFHFDDWGSIQSNMALRRPEATDLPPVARLLAPDRVVTQLTFAWDYRAAGLEAVRYHVVSLLFHLAASLMAFAYARSLLRRVGHPRAEALAVVVGGAFALHPVQTQAVAYTAQRAEVLASLFYLGALLLLDAAAARGWTLRAAATWGGGVVAWVLGMGSKTIAITAPAALVLDQAVVAPPAGPGVPGPARRAGRALLLALPMLGLAAWSAAIHLNAFAAAPLAGVGSGSMSALPASSYFVTQWRVQWLYLRLLAWPNALALDRTFVPSTGVDGAAALAGVGILALLALAAWLWWRAEHGRGDVAAQRIGAFGILFWFLVLVPTSSVIPVVDLAVEHRVYLAALGPMLAVAVGADALLRRLLPAPGAARAGAALAVLVLGGLAIGLVSRSRVWSSEETLWRDAAEKVPDNARILTNLGLALQAKGDLKGAEEAYERALPLATLPLHAVMLTRNYGGLLENLGRFQEALAILEQGLAIAPDHAELLTNRAVALVQLNRPEEAIADARKAVASSPGNPMLINILGEIYAYQARWPEALERFQAATALDPSSPLYFSNQALPLGALGRTAEACNILRETKVRYGPDAIPATSRRWVELIPCPR